MISLHPSVRHGNFCGHLATDEHTERDSLQKTTEREVGVWKDLPGVLSSHL